MFWIEVGDKLFGSSLVLDSIGECAVHEKHKEFTAKKLIRWTEISVRDTVEHSKLVCLNTENRSWLFYVSVWEPVTELPAKALRIIVQGAALSQCVTLCLSRAMSKFTAQGHAVLLTSVIRSVEPNQSLYFVRNRSTSLQIGHYCTYQLCKRAPLYMWHSRLRCYSHCLSKISNKLKQRRVAINWFIPLWPPWVESGGLAIFTK